MAPRLNDIALPLNVMKVMPIATQPTNDTVVSRANTLVLAKNPGVVHANMMSAAHAITRMMCAPVVSVRRGRSHFSDAWDLSEDMKGMFTTRYFLLSLSDG